MAAETAQERTERATPRRLQQARERGQVPRSRELNTAVLLLTAAGLFLTVGGYVSSGLLALIRRGLGRDRESLLTADAMTAALAKAIFEALVLIAPVLSIALLVALLTPLSIGGWAASARALRFDWERIDPLRGLGRLFSARSLVELTKAVAKFALITGLSVWLLWRATPALTGLARVPVDQAIVHAASLLGWSLLWLAAGMLLVAAADVPFQLWDHARRLRMTRQEVRDEVKETDGKPEVRARIRRLQQEMARRRMMAKVPTADVVVTNPTRFAVALRYDPGRMRAPVVVAKGVDLIAARIRHVAGEHRVPILRAPALARALYFSVELDREIPTGLYIAVAKVLAWVYQVKQGRPHGDGAPSAEDLPIPPDLRKD